MQLARREKYIVVLAACGLVVFLLLQFAIFPFYDGKARIRSGVRAKEEGLKEILKLSREYQGQKTGSQGIQEILAKRDKSFTLFSFLEKTAGEVEVKELIKYMKPSTFQVTGPYKESVVEMKLEKITLKQLVAYLYRIESPENMISIKRISIKEDNKESGYLDVILQVLTLQ